SAENTKGSMPPINKPAMTFDFDTSIVLRLAVVINAPNNASAVSAADAIAKPLPIAAVVFPTASSLSVRPRTYLGRPDISAMPPALSEIGPYASTASLIPRLESIPTAAIAIPYRPAKWNAPMIDKAMIRIGIAVDIIPIPRPDIIFVRSEEHTSELQSR